MSYDDPEAEMEGMLTP